MVRKKSIAAFVLIIVMLFTLFAGCSEKSKAMFLVNGDKIQNDDYMTHLFFTKYQLFSNEIQNGTMSLPQIYRLDRESLETKLSNDKTLEQTLKELVENTAMSACLYRQIAKENDLKLTDKEKQQVDASLSSFIKQLGGAAAYNNFLKQTKTTESALKRYFETSLYYAKIGELFAEGAAFDLTEEEKAAAKKEYEDLYITIRQIYLATVEPAYKTKLSQGTIEKKRKAAREAYDKLKKGTSFDLVIEEYNEAPKSKLTFAENSDAVDDKIEQKAFKMKTGEFSDIIETDEGFYIIKIDELSYEGLPSHYNYTRGLKMNNHLNEKAEQSVVEYKSAYKKIVIQ